MTREHHTVAYHQHDWLIALSGVALGLCIGLGVAGQGLPYVGVAAALSLVLVVVGIAP